MSTCHEVEHATRATTEQYPASVLQDYDWLEDHYVQKRLGTGTIAKLTGRSPSTVRYYLEGHGISMRTHRVSAHPRCDAAWLASHYLDRRAYIAWCRDRDIKPESDGGHGLSTGVIAKLVGNVSRESVRRWLHVHDIPVRAAVAGLRGAAPAKRMFGLGAGARAALRRFEQHPLVEGVRVGKDTIALTFTTGAVEHWERRHNEYLWWVFPGKGWWRDEPLPARQYHEPGTEAFFEYPATTVQRAGFFDQRLLVHGLAKQLSREGWYRPDFPESALHQDLADLQADRTKYAISRGCLRGQPGRPRSGPPPGMVLCNTVRDWGGLLVEGRPSLASAWRDPRRLAPAIDQIVRKGQALNRAAIIRRMTMGSSYGLPTKAGPRWMSPNFYTAVLRDILGINTRPVVLDASPGCGARAVATAMMSGINIHPADTEFSSRGPLWQDGAELAADDGDVTADVGFVECADAVEFEAAVEDYGRRCCFVVAVLPWDEREGALALPGVRVVRYKPRPYMPDAIIAVWQARE